MAKTLLAIFLAPTHPLFSRGQGENGVGKAYHPDEFLVLFVDYQKAESSTVAR
jgi:hypothetical protein